MHDTDERPLTRREAANFLTEQGYRITFSTLNYLCQSSIDKGPPSIGRWGKGDLYLPSALLSWARERAATWRNRLRSARPDTEQQPAA